jgi:putative addiction module component (TIGR02574 family)
MSTAVLDIEKKALAMPAVQRVRLAEKLVASVDTFATPEIESAWHREIERRVKDIESGKEPAITAAEALAAARKAVHESRCLSSARRKRTR